VKLYGQNSANFMLLEKPESRASSSPLINRFGRTQTPSRARVPGRGHELVNSGPLGEAYPLSIGYDMQMFFGLSEFGALEE